LRLCGARAGGYSEKRGIAFQLTPFSATPLASNVDAIEGAAVVTSVADKDVRDVSDGALGVSIVGTRAIDPGVVVSDVKLTLGMGETEEATRDDGHEILLVIDAVHLSRSVDGADEGIVANSRHTVGDGTDCGSRNIALEVQAGNRGKSTTKGVSHNGDTRGSMACNASPYRGKNSAC